MAYPVKEFTAQEYTELPSDVYEVMTPEKIYYMPEIIGGIATWSINLYNIDNQQGNPIVTLNDTPIQTGYRVLMTTEISGTVSGQQSHLVIDSGYDPQNNPWIKAENNFQTLPIGTVVTWTYFTQSYSATTNGAYTTGQGMIKEYVGTYLDFGQEQPSLPSNNSYVYTQSEDVIVYKYRIYIINNDGEVVFNQVFDPTTYQLNGFLVKNEATIMQ